MDTARQRTQMPPKPVTDPARLWSAAARDWAELDAPLTATMQHAALDAGRVGRGTRLLDIGCGSGETLLLAILRGAEATGLDVAPGLVEIARERLPHADLRVGDMQELPFQDGAFDAALHVNTLMFAPDRARAVQEARRVLAPAGRLVIASWADPQRCGLAALLDAVAGLLPQRPPGGGPFALAAPDAVPRLVSEAGLRVVASHEVPCPLHYRSADELVAGMLATGPVQGAAILVGAEKVRAAIASAAAAFRLSDGSHRIENVVRVTAAVPE